MYDAHIDITSIPPELEMDYSRILNKPFVVGTYPWTTGTSLYTELMRIPFPSSITNNYLASIPFNSASKFRAKMCAMLQVSGTPMHQGTVLVAALPHKHPKVINPNQLLSAPHVFLSANESTSACLELPFYSNNDVINTPSKGKIPHSNLFNDYVDLVFMVLNKLTPGDGASTDLTISVHAMFNEARFFVPQTIVDWVAQSSCETESDYEKNRKLSVESECISKRCLATTLLRAIVSSIITKLTFGLWTAQSWSSKLLRIPTYIFDGLETGARKVTGDLIDVARGGLRALTGFHNPNSPAINQRVVMTTRNFHNAVDQPTLFEKLDQHAQFNRIAQTPIFETLTDEMSITNIVCKPAFMGQFVVSTESKQGEVVMSHPITPMIELVKGSDFFYSPMRLIYESSRYWRGDLELTIQSSMTNFQYCKLMVVRNYENTQELLTKMPSYNSVHNLMCETLEFSAGGQTQSIKLPYCSEMNQLPCTSDDDLNAMQHGMVYIYVVQPTTTNGTTPKALDFNVFMKGTSNLTFYGYAGEPIYMEKESIDHPSIRPLPLFKTPIPTEPQESRELAIDAPYPQFYPPESSEWKPQSETAPTTVTLTDQTHVVNDTETLVDEPDLYALDFKPMVSIRDYLRRVIHNSTFTYEPPTDQTPTLMKLADVFQIDVATLVAGKYAYSSRNTPTWTSLKKMFFGSTCGYKIKLKIGGATAARVVYSPPQESLSREQDRTLRHIPWSTSLGTEAAALTKEVLYGNATRRSYPEQDREISSTQTEYFSSQTEGGCELEVLIPYMNSRRCVSSIADLSVEDYQETSNAMGTLTISVARARIDPKSELPHIITICTAIGITDESRLGFQVINAKKRATPVGVTTRLPLASYLGVQGNSTAPPSNSAAYYWNVA